MTSSYEAAYHKKNKNMYILIYIQKNIFKKIININFVIYIKN